MKTLWPLKTIDKEEGLASAIAGDKMIVLFDRLLLAGATYTEGTEICSNVLKEALRVHEFRMQAIDATIIRRGY